MAVAFVRRWSVVCLTVCCAAGAAAYDWPVLRDSVYKPIGNSYGQYQCYGEDCSPYFHSGIDIMAPEGEPVYAVKSGYVKAILTTSADTHWRVVIGDSAGAAGCDAWMYAHVAYFSIVMEADLHVGDWVEEGQYIGDVVYFPYYEFNHLHFSKIRYAGASWDDWAEWEFVGNPLNELATVADPDPPVFENTYEEQIFAFCQNQTVLYYGPGDTLTGEVDIICRVYDYINDYDYKVTPDEIAYRIDDDPWATGVSFSGGLGTYETMAGLISVVYRDDATFNTLGDYVDREYYITVTNSDGDSVVEVGDKPFAWRTPDYNNGTHTVYIQARDRADNSTTESMEVVVENYFALSGAVTLDDVVPQPLSGISISVIPDGASDTTDVQGEFAWSAIGGGPQQIEIAKPGFQTLDTMLMMNTERYLEATLVPGGYVPGDANCNGSVNVSDAIYIVSYVFRGGPAPVPYASGDADCDGTVNIADAVYLVNYIFKGGPPPGEC